MWATDINDGVYFSVLQCIAVSYRKFLHGSRHSTIIAFSVFPISLSFFVAGGGSRFPRMWAKEIYDGVCCSVL